MRSARVRLEDIADAIEGIKVATREIDVATFAENWIIRRAVERGLEIISEASRGIPEPSRSDHPEVPWAQIAGIGNVLRHDYHRVEPLIIWNIVQTHLLALEMAVKQMLEADHTSS